MSKNCSICNNKINFMSEYNLNKDSKKKICFECYQYLATALKGDKNSLNILKNRYKDDISADVTQYIGSIAKNITNTPINKPSEVDHFIDLTANNIIPENVDNHKHKHSQSIIYIDKLSKSKIARLKTVKIISNICFTALLIIIPLLSFYLFAVAHLSMNAIIVLLFGISAIVLFYLIRTIVDTILEEKQL